MQPDDRPVVLLHVLRGARRIVHGDGFTPFNEVYGVHRLVVLAHEVEALGRTRMIVERDAWADHVDERRPVMRHRGLYQRHELPLVARERAPDERRTRHQRHADQVDRRVVVGAAGLRLRPAVRRRRELPLGQPINAVVLGDVDHVHAAPHAVHELPQPDRRRVAVAGNAEIKQIPVRHIRARQDRRHPPMHAVEAVTLPQQIVRRLRRTPDARQLRHAMRLDVELKARLDQRRRNRVMPATRTQRRYRAFVIAMRKPALVLLETRMPELRLGEIGHDATFVRGGLPKAFSRSAISLVMKRAVIGVPS